MNLIFHDDSNNFFDYYCNNQHEVFLQIVVDFVVKDFCLCFEVYDVLKQKQKKKKLNEKEEQDLVLKKKKKLVMLVVVDVDDEVDDDDKKKKAYHDCY